MGERVPQTKNPVIGPPITAHVKWNWSNSKPSWRALSGRAESLSRPTKTMYLETSVEACIYPVTARVIFICVIHTSVIYKQHIYNRTAWQG